MNSGFFIPVEKQSLFILVFEEILLNSFNFLPIFGPAKEDNSCEVIFNYTGTDQSKCLLNKRMAKLFLEQNQQILHYKRQVKNNLRKSSPGIKIINLVDEVCPSKPCETMTVDLTEVEPEIIVLDETVTQLNKTLDKLDVSLQSIGDIEIIDAIKTSSPLQRKNTHFRNKVDILNVKANRKLTTPTATPLSSAPSSEVVVVSSNGKLKKCKQNKVNQTSNLIISLDDSGSRSVVNSEKQPKTAKRRFSRSSANSTPQERKKRKLQDVSNIPQSVTSPIAKPLTDNVLKYYSRVNDVVQRIRPKKNISKRNSPKNKHNPVKCLKRNKRNRNKGMQKNTFNHHDKKEHGVVDTNTFNPHPYEVDKEGLRPVVIDGCNIAMGHGRGSFSVNGIKFCVDCFALKGHKNIKVFLPNHYRRHFSDKVLAELKTKCDMVFTPSRNIDGVQTASYDDRFIVQYAYEFGGVIVSNDTYRDLLKENPKWQNTIKNRLLMFSWADDLLMFPSDPLGRRGPSLDQFLRF